MTRKNPDKIENYHVAIDNIQAHISAKFQELRYPIATIEFDLPILDKFAVDNSMRLNLDTDEAIERARNVWFAIASIQLSVGYMLVAIDSAKFPRGLKQTVYDIKDLEVDINIGDLHFWYHYNTAIECAYRVWERLSNLLKFFVRIAEGENRFYFNEVIQYIKNSTDYCHLPYFQELYNHIKHCSRVTGERNKISHKICRLFGKDKVEKFDLPIIKRNGSKFKKLEAESTDLYQVVDDICNKYKQCMAGVDNTMKFINSLPNL